jgi:hypothetical protein
VKVCKKNGWLEYRTIQPVEVDEKSIMVKTSARIVRWTRRHPVLFVDGLSFPKVALIAEDLQGSRQ